jgi:hypothetical protein
VAELGRWAATRELYQFREEAMNKRQWQILVFGALATVLVIAFGASHPSQPMVGPVVEHIPGHYSQSFTETVLPFWVLLAALGLSVLTGALVHRSRTGAA